GDGTHRGGDPPAVLRARCRMFGHVLTPGLLRCLVNYRSSVFRVENCASTAGGRSSLRCVVLGRDEQGACGIADESGAGVVDMVGCAEAPGLGSLLGVEDLPVVGRPRLRAIVVALGGGLGDDESGPDGGELGVSVQWCVPALRPVEV